MLFDLYNDARSRISRVAPTKLSLILTHKCNSRCVMCNIWQERKSGELSPSEYQQIFSDPFFSRVSRIILTGGEASLRPDFLEICSALVDALPQLRKITLATNGIATNIVLERVKGMLEFAKAEKSPLRSRCLLTVSEKSMIVSGEFLRRIQKSGEPYRN